MAESSRPGDEPADHATLVRLANSYARVANADSRLRDLDEEDYRTIAAILRRLATAAERSMSAVQPVIPGA